MGVLIPCMECACSRRCLSPGAPQVKDRYFVWIGKCKLTLSGNGHLSRMWALHRACDPDLKGRWERLHLPTASSGSDDEEWSAFLSCPAYSILCKECFIIRCCFVVRLFGLLTFISNENPHFMISLGVKYSMCSYWITRGGQRVWFHATKVKAKIWKVLCRTFIIVNQG